MKIDVLRQPLMATLLLFAAMAALFIYRFQIFPYPEELSVNSVGPIQGFLSRFESGYPVIAGIISGIFIFFNGISVSRILSQHMVVSSRSYLPIVFYIAVSCGIWFGGVHLPAVIAAFMILRSIEYFISSFIRKASFNQTFRGSLLVGLTPIIYPAGTLYLLAIPLAMAVFRRKGREVIVAITGGLLPLLTYAYVMWALDFGFAEPLADIGRHLVSGTSSLHIGTQSITEILRLIPIALIGGLTLMGLASFAMTSGTMRTRARAIFIYFIMLLLIGCGSLLMPAASPAALALFAIPASAIMPLFFSQFPGWVSGTAYTLTLLSLAALNLYPLLFA